MYKTEKRSFGDFLFDNKVVLLFVVMCVVSFFISGKPLEFVLGELFTRIGRNAFLVLALIIPILTGMGLNFGLAVGAIAAQIAMFWILYWNFTGMKAILLIIAMGIPLAVVFGWLVGALFNKMKGSEMFGGMVLGFFSDGLYQFFFLFVIGGIIPVAITSPYIINDGVGVKNAIDLLHSIKYAIDSISFLSFFEVAFYIFVGFQILRLIYRLVSKQDLEIKKWGLQLGIAVACYGLTFIPFIERLLNISSIRLLQALEAVLVVIVLRQVIKIIRIKRSGDPQKKIVLEILLIALCGVGYGLTYVGAIYRGLSSVKIPIVTYLLIAGICLFNSVIMKTRLGQNMRTVGQNRVVANAAGINVDRTRIIAMIFSTVLACIGQVISLQNLGSFQTYTSHMQVSHLSIAALLVGGASVQKATNKQALLGVVLFHSLAILMPEVGSVLFGNPQTGENFRVFVTYGIVAVSLAMHAWQGKSKTSLKPLEAKKSIEL